jgi:1,4-alpha-glucan branching enzyme
MNSQDGVATHVTLLTRYLEKNGVDVTVLAVDVISGTIGKIEKIWIRPFLEYRHALHPRTLLLPALSLMLKVMALHMRKRIDILHFHDSTAFAASYPVVALLGIPTLHTIHSLSIVRPETSPYPPHVARKYLMANRVVIKKATRIICVSSDTRQRAVQVAGDSNRLQVIPNFIDQDSVNYRIESMPRPSSACLFVGSLLKIKGVDHLLAAVPEVLRIHPEASFTIVGDGPERERLEQVVDQLGIRSKVQYVGRVDREAAAEWYQQAGLVVVPSMDEAQSIVVLEAFAHGLPVVASNVGGIPDVVKDGHNGLLIPPGDAAALAAGVCRFIDDRQLWNRCSFNARETAHRYSWEQGILQILDLYQEVLKR